VLSTKSWLYKRRLKHCGKSVVIFRSAQLIKPRVISIGDHSQIDDFVWLLGGEEIRIGNRVHIATFTSCSGGGRFIIEDFSGISAGCRIITGSEDFSGAAMTNPCIPIKYRNVSRSFVHIKAHAVLATGVVVYPGVTIGEGAVVGAGSHVTRDLEAWTVNHGVPCRRIRSRPKEKLLQMEKELTGFPELR